MRYNKSLKRLYKQIRMKHRCFLTKLYPNTVLVIYEGNFIVVFYYHKWFNEYKCKVININWSIFSIKLSEDTLASLYELYMMQWSDLIERLSTVYYSSMDYDGIINHVIFIFKLYSIIKNL